MHVVVTGATGFIGRGLVLRLQRDGHRVTAWVRDRARARAAVGPDVTLVEVEDEPGWHAAVATADAVVNLAGAPIVGGPIHGRWTARRKAELVASRLESTRAVTAAIQAAARDGHRPVLVSASASGYYGDRGDAPLAEVALPGQGFAAELCRDWEDAANEAIGHAARVVITRFGIVLGREGGAFAELEPLARAGLGGPIAGGAQWVPWIHLADAVDAIVFALASPTLSGPVNVVGPQPVTQREFAHALGRAVHRPAVAPAPGFVMRALLGEAASVLTASQRVIPEALMAAGFEFAYPELAGALDDLTRARGVHIRAARPDEVPASDYNRARRPRYVLVARTELAAPLEDVFAFFSSAENLPVLTPPAMTFAIETPRPIAMHPGTVIDYKLHVVGVPARWRTVIERWEPPVDGHALFVDAQDRGPYRAWWHEHRFASDGDHTVMEDHVFYAPPLGVLGTVANRVLVESQLRRIFGYRTQMIRERFGVRA